MKSLQKEVNPIFSKMSLSVTSSVNLRHNTLKSVVLDDEADGGLFGLYFSFAI